MKNKNIEQVLLSIYTDPSNPASFSSIKKLYEAAKKIEKNISIGDVKSFLKNQLSYTLHFPTKKKFLTQKVISAKPKIIVGLDLIDMQKFSFFNNNIKYLMFFIDLFSKYVTVLPLKNKNKYSILDGLKLFFKMKDNHLYSRIYSDMESGLKSELSKQFLNENRIVLYTNSSKERKNSITERNLKTLKNKIYKYMTHKNTNTYIHDLPNLVESINNGEHKALKNKKLTPKILHEITNREILKKQFQKMFAIKRKHNTKINQSLKENDIVRIPKTDYTQSHFFKKYNILNTEELFKIKSINRERYPYLYKLIDLSNDEIEGSFYQAELVPSALRKTYPIKILKTKQTKSGKQFYVSWFGYGEKFNNWISEKDIIAYNAEK